MNEEEIKKELSQSGYDNVYTWDAEPNEDDSDHSHEFDTRLVILKGEIEIGMDGSKTVLKVGDRVDIPRGKIHFGTAGVSGCRYIVAEKH